MAGEAKDKTSNPPTPQGTRERLAQKKHAREADKGEQVSFLQRIRGYADALVFAYVLAMFIRTFVFELFMIPTGSMTPTLIGDVAGELAFMDYDGDGIEDIVYTFPTRGSLPANQLQVFLMNADGTYKDLIFLDNVERRLAAEVSRQSIRRRDMILVNKFAYWFTPPRRGDVAVFKVPYRPQREQRWEVDKPVYIKRVVGLPGETIMLRPVEFVRFGFGDPNRYSNLLGGDEIHIFPRSPLANGNPIDDGTLGNTIQFPITSGTRYPRPTDRPNEEVVDDRSVLMLGDNAASSSDGRYWGPVPLDHLRGKAILRYLPLSAFGRLDPNRHAPPISETRKIPAPQ